MPGQDATIIVGKLSDSELQNSINKLVQIVEQASKQMADSFDTQITRMKKSLASLGNVNVNFGGTNDTGSERRTNALRKEEQTVNEVKASYDNFARSQQIAIRQGSDTFRNSDTLETMRMQLDLLRQNLVDARQQYSSFVALAAQATKTGDEGLYKFATAGVHQYEEQVKSLIPQIRTMQTAITQMEGVVSSQGHTIQNYANSIGKITPELAMLNEQYKKGDTMLKEHTSTVNQDVQAQQKEISLTEEQKQKLAELQERLKQVKEERKAASKAFQDAGWDRFGARLNAGAYPDDINAQNKLANADRVLAEATEKLNAVKNEQAKIESEIKSIIHGTTAAVKESTEITKMSTEQIKKRAQAIRESETYQKGETTVLATLRDGTQIVAQSEKKLSLEDQIINAIQRENELIQQQAKEQDQENQKLALTNEQLKEIWANQGRVNQEFNKRAAGRLGGTSIFQSYDDLRASIASALQIQQEGVLLADTQNASYNQLSRTLKQLKQAYDNLSKSDRLSEQGVALAASMHEVERAMYGIRKQAARPVNLKEAMGLSERTIDDIAYKMQQLSAYRSGLDVDVRRAEIREVNAEYDRLKKKMDEVMQKNQQMMGSNNALSRSWNYMKNRLAFYFTVGASTQFIKNLIEVRSQYEMNERALGILIGRAERGTEIFNQLSQMALVSPYTLIELSSAAKQLTAYDIAAKDVVDTTRRLADMASAVGVPMERLTYALGQIKAYGYLNSRDARMFANAGIPLVKELSKYYTELEGKMVSVGDVYDRMKKKAIGFNEVMSVVTKMTDEGGKFFDFQAKMADTLKVRLANLTLAWNNMLNDIGAETQGVLTTMIGGLKTLFANWRKISDLLSNVAWTFGFAKLAQAIVISTIGLKAFGKQMTWNILLGRKMSAVLFSLGRSLRTIVTSPLTWFGVLATAVTAATMAIWNMNEAQESLNKSLRESAKENVQSIQQFLGNYESIRKSLYKEERNEKTGDIKITPIDIDKGEAKKAWEAIREQIELSSHASDDYLSRLLLVENISERVRKGFEVLDEIQTVSAALKELGDDAIKVDTDWSDWWNANLLPDGWVDNLKQYQKELDNVAKNYENVAEARARWEENRFKDANLNEDFTSLNRSLRAFQNDLAITAESVYDFLTLKGWNYDENKINEVFKQIQDKLIQEGQLNPNEAFVLQTQWEEARAQVAKLALYKRLEDEKAAYAAAQDEMAKKAIAARYEALAEQYNHFEEFNGKSKAYWNNFTKWLKEQHLSETTEMFRGMDAEQIKSLNFQEGKYGDWVTRMVTKYAKEHKMSYDDAFNYLKHWVANANQWSIFIPLTISTEDDKTVYQALTEADTAMDTAYKKIQRLKERQAQLNAIPTSKLTKEQTEESVKIVEELASAWKDYNKAKEAGGKSKKEDSANRKAQKQAESELQTALKEEISLINQVSSAYEKLTKDGMNHIDAINSSTRGFDETVSSINRSLARFGLEKLDLSKFVGTTNPKAVLDMLENQLNVLVRSPYVKPAEIKELQVEIQKLQLKVDEFNQKTITDSLNNELNKLKDEYELAVALDADPEMGNMFAEMFGIDTDELPHTIEQYANKYLEYFNKFLQKKKTGIQLSTVFISDEELAKYKELYETEKLTEEAYKAILNVSNTFRDLERKNISERIKDWNKLIEKYGEYEAKITKVQNDAVNERISFVKQFGSDSNVSKAIQLGTQIQATHDPEEKQRLIDELKELVNDIAGNEEGRLKIAASINRGELQNAAKIAFEEFEKSPEWATATGDLTSLTNSAIGGLISKLQQYKKSAKYLDPKQIKQINNALKNLYKQQRSGNPFAAIANSMDEARERFDDFQVVIDSVGEKIEFLISKRKKNGHLTESEENELRALIQRYQELSEEQERVGKVSATTIVNGIQQAISAASQAASVFTDMMDALGGTNGSRAAQNIKKVVGVLEKGGQGAALGAQIGGGWGAAIGGIIGTVSGVLTEFADELSGNASITEGIERSERAVKQLTNTYKQLEDAVEQAYGTAAIGAKRATITNKELQLAELKRQLQLEESRKSKNKDEDKIEELKGQIIDLELEIKNATNDIVNDLLNISSVGDAAENIVSQMIDAFKKGEDYMGKYSESFEEMIDNMIMKSIVGEVIGKRMEEIFASVDEIARKRAEESKVDAAEIFDDLRIPRAWVREYQEGDGSGIQSMTNTIQQWRDFFNWVMPKTNDEGKKIYGDALNKLNSIYSSLISVTPEDVQGMRNTVNGWKEGVKTEFESWMDAFGILFGQEGVQDTLSALQQGIQGITEDTAGALEGYMNGVSQQVYLQSDYLMQIRDTLVSFDLDVQVSTMSQILLQLQNSYSMQETIKNIMEGWSNSNGMAVRVEMI